MNILLWIIQIVLALLFLFAGVPKLIFSVDELMKNAPPGAISFPDFFLKFIGVCEILGALGLILPGLFRKKQELTPLAALGLFIIMVGAVVVSIMGTGVSTAIVPFIVALLCAFVAYGRWKLSPLR
jgi:uncharacterized membrane protein YphA (DoxX/SURF4 family)